jgi:hypothetical protein
MAYRNGTYVAFHANGTAEPTESDMKYYQLLKAWKVRSDGDFEFINSHDKTAAVRDTSSRQTLRNRLAERLRNSKNMLLIIGDTTRFDTDWVPFEIEYAVDTCRIPIIAAYPKYEWIQRPADLRALWPNALATRIDNRTASVIHIPFKQAPLAYALPRFSPDELPANGGLGFYSPEAYRQFGIELR